MWSPVEQTALAEAEVEYKDRRATQIYVKFPVRNSDIGDASVVIWTTTPWTIPANRAVSYSKNIVYHLYEITEMEESEFEPWCKVGERLIVARDLWENVKKAGLIKSATYVVTHSKDWFEDMVLDHPLKNMEGADGKYDFPVPLLEGDHVTVDAGTGFVHTAPSHGEDDYNVWVSNQKKLESLGIDRCHARAVPRFGCYPSLSRQETRAGRQGQWRSPKSAC